ncbi:hypothetical protein A3B02_00755 [Candidatus Roizmanbacteria bacterium RIFCSPLOWO2_01_FULL_42_14]|uniref:Uncharacterized protein n=3 Tax=Candidatus Roizmaniibacteriota TaxID=1752723 RepID=A0A1F7JAH4_9BACT|nr:MAG: hypothetical protein A3D08_01550 [Candidatus Roizmanbacteria bacterium RIFCSPHIGHO2_02_FULL_43_11]OGK38835.1 MAG: hypothetical protein A3F32_02025 [Candidatus Roizmanbacteria bacterium RIFCSPHIGHO2_12_FULL_42_10]OGK52612.1 MAG: hypothetical protein A3B02_00755 [Candidatus Roizmanbacteria bacterium RIFCSPLOWO2_01_FULL_42_14]
MTDQIYSHLRKRYNEVFSLEPNDLHVAVLTNYFKRLSPYLKYQPFRAIIPVSCLITLLMLIFEQVTVVKLVSVLQYGF